MSLAGNLNYKLTILSRFKRVYPFNLDTKVVMLAGGVFIWTLMLPCELILRYYLSGMTIEDRPIVLSNLLADLVLFNTAPTRYIL